MAVSVGSKKFLKYIKSLPEKGMADGIRNFDYYRNVGYFGDLPKNKTTKKKNVLGAGAPAKFDNPLWNSVNNSNSLKSKVMKTSSKKRWLSSNVKKYIKAQKMPYLPPF